MRPSSLSIALAALLLATPLLAQDSPDSGAPEGEATSLKVERSYKLWLEWTPWYVQPTGLELDLVTEIDPISSDLFRGRTLPTPWGTEDATRWRFGVTLPKDLGAVTLSYWSTSNHTEGADSRPGTFLWGTNLAYGAYAGIFDDSLADTYAYQADLGTRDLRIAYQRALASGPRFTANGSIGIRWVDASLVYGAAYAALGAPIPAFYDPPPPIDIAAVFPIPDRATSESRFSGRGLSTALEVVVPLGKVITLEGSFDATLMRGDRKASYTSHTSAYLINLPEGTFYLGKDDLLNPDITGNVSLLQSMFQATLPVFADDTGSTASTFSLEAHLGFRAKIWRTFEALGGVRMVHYDGILSEIRPLPVTSVGTAAVPGVERRERTLSYEGLYVGLAYTY